MVSSFPGKNMKRQKHPDYNRIVIGLMEIQELIDSFGECVKWFGASRIPVPSYDDRINLKKKENALRFWCEVSSVYEENSLNDFLILRRALCQIYEHEDGHPLDLCREMPELVQVASRATLYSRAILKLLELFDELCDLQTLYRMQRSQLADFRNYLQRYFLESSKTFVPVFSLPRSGSCYQATQAVSPVSYLFASSRYLEMLFGFQAWYLKIEQLQFDGYRVAYYAEEDNRRAIFKGIGIDLPDKVGRRECKVSLERAIEICRGLTLNISGKPDLPLYVLGNLILDSPRSSRIKLLNSKDKPLRFIDELGWIFLHQKNREGRCFYETPIELLRYACHVSALYLTQEFAEELNSTDETWEWYSRQIALSRLRIKQIEKIRHVLRAWKRANSRKK